MADDAAACVSAQRLTDGQLARVQLQCGECDTPPLGSHRGPPAALGRRQHILSIVSNVTVPAAVDLERTRRLAAHAAKARAMVFFCHFGSRWCR